MLGLFLSCLRAPQAPPKTAPGEGCESSGSWVSITTRRRSGKGRSGQMSGGKHDLPVMVARACLPSRPLPPGRGPCPTPRPRGWRAQGRCVAGGRGPSAPPGARGALRVGRACPSGLDPDPDPPAGFSVASGDLGDPRGLPEEGKPTLDEL